MTSNEIDEIIGDCFLTGISANITGVNSPLKQSNTDSAKETSKVPEICVPDNRSNSNIIINEDLSKTSASPIENTETNTNIARAELNLNNRENPNIDIQMNTEESEKPSTKNASWTDIIGKEDARRKSIVQLYINQPRFEYTPELFYKALGMTTD